MVPALRGIMQRLSTESVINEYEAVDVGTLHGDDVLNLQIGKGGGGSEILHAQQAEALPKRSAIDLVAALIHDIEEAVSRKQVATLVTMDIQGTSDTVMRNRRILRLGEQGWPQHLAR